MFVSFKARASRGQVEGPSMRNAISFFQLVREALDVGQIRRPQVASVNVV